MSTNKKQDTNARQMISHLLWRFQNELSGFELKLRRPEPWTGPPDSPLFMYVKVLHAKAKTHFNGFDVILEFQLQGNGTSKKVKTVKKRFNDQLDFSRVAKWIIAYADGEGASHKGDGIVARTLKDARIFTRIRKGYYPSQSSALLYEVEYVKSQWKLTHNYLAPTPTMDFFFLHYPHGSAEVVTVQNITSALLHNGTSNHMSDLKQKLNDGFSKLRKDVQNRRNFVNQKIKNHSLNYLQKKMEKEGKSSSDISNAIEKGRQKLKSSSMLTPNTSHDSIRNSVKARADKESTKKMILRKSLHLLSRL